MNSPRFRLTSLPPLYGDQHALLSRSQTLESTNRAARHLAGLANGSPPGRPRAMLDWMGLSSLGRVGGGAAVVAMFCLIAAGSVGAVPGRRVHFDKIVLDPVFRAE